MKFILIAAQGALFVAAAGFPTLGAALPWIIANALLVGIISV